MEIIGTDEEKKFLLKWLKQTCLDHPTRFPDDDWEEWVKEGKITKKTYNRLHEIVKDIDKLHEMVKKLSQTPKGQGGSDGKLDNQKMAAVGHDSTGDHQGLQGRKETRGGKKGARDQ